MQVIPEKLCELAQACLDASQDLNKGWTSEQGSMQVDSDAAGNSSAGPGLVNAHASAADDAGVAIGRLVSVLEHDMDGLYQCAFDFSCTDESEASKYESNVLELPGLGVI